MTDWNKYMVDGFPQLAQSDLCPCDVLKSKCTHPNCNEAKAKICPACNQEPCTCLSECDSCGA